MSNLGNNWPISTEGHGVQTRIVPALLVMDGKRNKRSNYYDSPPSIGNHGVLEFVPLPSFLSPKTLTAASPSISGTVRYIVPLNSKNSPYHFESRPLQSPATTHPAPLLPVSDTLKSLFFPKGTVCFSRSVPLRFSTKTPAAYLQLTISSSSHLDSNRL